MCKNLENCSFYQIIIVILLTISTISSVLSVIFLFCEKDNPNIFLLLILPLSFLGLSFYLANLQYKSEQNEKEFHQDIVKKLINKNEEENLASKNQDYRLKLLEWEKTYQIITALAQKTEKQNKEGDKITTYKINIEIMNDLEKAVKSLLTLKKKNDE
ncbi:MAG TPA: hypothetical protein DCX89_05060 [Saprospirales bacterium]|nr:hypothetical protein [Saprospirales bacterium]HAY71239.1 hypothetical protein [Saprospirales bacterium]HRQ30556.1 hypothetical protein [Saprospiraceae bacterium]